MKFYYFISIAAFLMTLLSCTGNNGDENNQTKKLNEEELIKANKYLIKRDAEVIKNYIDRRNWDMKETETGLWYMVYEKHDGTKIEKGDQVVFNYEVSLLDGTKLYDSERIGAKKVNLGHEQLETGLEQGLTMLHEGEKGRFIIPPHLGHGLIGDQNKIPGRSVILYQVEILEVHKK